MSDNALSKQCLSLGNYEINEYTKIGIFEVELNEKVNISRNRVALRNLLKDITKQMSGAMVVFVQGDKWRFSYVSKRKVKNTITNEIEDKETAPKRYTYLFGNGEKALTAAQRFDKLIQKQKDNLFDLLSFDDFEDAFSVEKLGKEFFANYKEIYEDFVEYITGYRYVKKGSKWTVSKTHEPHFDFHDIFNNDDKAVRDFFKRMLGRIVFLYFIQKKGWLAVPKSGSWDKGNPEYLYQLFKNAQYKELFYSDYLVQLFFETLNNPKSEDEDNDFRFPYLNGGLFDKSQDERYDKLALPSHIFDKLFEKFNNYNFTIYEDAPDEHTVAVDPEMLGHIFEKLLEDNKDKGAFYTPKEIVHYMCKESLQAYLIAQDEQLFVDELAKTALDKIIQQQELSDDEKQIAEKNAYKIIDDLEQVKICDPAIGSGAFPMGLLQEIFNAIIYLQELKGFKKGVTDADIKKHIIEKSIYGVDIDAGAVDIARLRFWLSLVVDEPEPQPLPNLDFKIVCANTLIPLGKINGLDMEAKASLAVKELEKIRDKFFNSSSDNKLHLEREFKRVQTDLLSLRELTTKDNFEFYTKLYEFSPFDYESLPCSWFDPWWMFGVKDGFDIVIGNPPYISTKGIDAKTKKDFEKAYGFADDTYNHFFFKGVELLKENGVLSYITPKTFWTTQTKRNLRDLLLSKKVNYIFDTANPFEAAMVDTCVTSVVNANSDDNIISFLDGSKDLANPLKYEVPQEVYLNTQNSVIFKPTEENMKIFNLYGRKVKDLYNQWWDKISTSKNIEKNKTALETYRKNLKPGDIALLGCLTEGGQGLATANNGKYIAVRKSTKWAKNIETSRPKKLAEAIRENNIKIARLEKYGNTTDFLNALSETEIAELFDSLKVQYGRDIFGQGYIYRLVEDSEIADVDTLTEDEKQNGIDKNKNYYVPYDKGDKDGNRWYLETPFAIAWHKENVGFLKTDKNARYQGHLFYFRKGFCWTDVNSTYLKARLKKSGVFDVLSMSLFTQVEIPDWYFVSMINSRLISFYVDNFINNTSHFQINDARQLPIIIPSKENLKMFETLFNNAVKIKISQAKNEISNDVAEQKLSKLQTQLDEMINDLYSVI